MQPLSFWPFKHNYKDIIGKRNGKNKGATIEYESLFLSKETSYVKIPKIDISKSFTIATWIRKEPGGESYVMGDWREDNWKFLAFVTCTGGLRLFLRQNKFTNIIPDMVAPGVHVTDEWTHIAYVWDSFELKARTYANGKLIEEVSALIENPKLTSSDSKTYSIGHKDDGGKYSPTWISDLCIFNYALTREEIITVSLVWISD